MMKTILEHPLIQELLEQGEREHQLSGPEHLGQGRTQRQSGEGHMMRTRAKWSHLMEVTMKKRRQKMIREAKSAPSPLPSDSDRAGRKPEQSCPLDLSIPRPVTRLLEIKYY